MKALVVVTAALTRDADIPVENSSQSEVRSQTCFVGTESIAPVTAWVTCKTEILVRFNQSWWRGRIGGHVETLGRQNSHSVVMPILDLETFDVSRYEKITWRSSSVG